jgi:hypothetical protein
MYLMSLFLQGKFNLDLNKKMHFFQDFLMEKFSGRGVIFLDAIGSYGSQGAWKVVYGSLKLLPEKSWSSSH